MPAIPTPSAARPPPTAIPSPSSTQSAAEPNATASERAAASHTLGGRSGTASAPRARIAASGPPTNPMTSARTTPS